MSHLQHLLDTLPDVEAQLFAAGALLCARERVLRPGESRAQDAIVLTILESHGLGLMLIGLAQELRRLRERPPDEGRAA